MIHPMWQAYPGLQDHLESIQTLMVGSIQLKDQEIKQAILNMIQKGGKMARPAYLVLFAQMSQAKDWNQVHALAAAMELLHVASLLHDDVVDESDLRRGQATLRAAYGNRIAIYAGDYVLTRCYSLLADYAEDLKGIQVPTSGMERVLEGELSQLRDRYDTKGGISSYLDRIQGKTAELFRLAAYAGASLGDQVNPQRAGKIGSHIGMAFQLLDDALDYQVTASQFGKPVLEDVAQGVYSAPLLYALEKGEESLRPLLDLRDQISPSQRQDLQKLVIKAGGVDRTLQLAGYYTQKALGQIDQLPPSPARNMLTDLTLDLLSRKS